MAAPNMAAMTASLEKSLQNFSLNHHEHSSSSSSSSSNCIGGGIGDMRYVAGGDKSSAADSPGNVDLLNDSSLDLHSEIPLPHFWEQCLDLKTGEIYYINWRSGMKSQEDPRKNPVITADCYSDDDDNDDDSYSYDSDEGSSSESSRTVIANEEWQQYNNINWEKNIVGGGSGTGSGGERQVLVVAGCKSCLMYFMVPKQEEECPKCCGQLLHFDSSNNGSA